MIIPHPHSHQDVRRFDYPSQAEIVGRVTGVAMRIVAESLRREPAALYGRYLCRRFKFSHSASA